MRRSTSGALHRRSAPPWVFFCTAAVLLLPAPGRAQSSAAFYDQPPVLNPGDVLQVHVWRQPEFSGEFEVTGEGTIGHPLYRGILVANRSVAEVEDEIRTLLRSYVEEPSFLV